jgi:transposase
LEYARVRGGFGVSACNVRSPHEKESVERLVGWLKSSFFKCRKFQVPTYAPDTRRILLGYCAPAGA